MSALLLGLMLLISTSEDALSIKIEPAQKDGMSVVDWNKHLLVTLTNTSGKPIQLMNHETRAGYQQLSFQFTNMRTGAKYLVHQPSVKDEALWRGSYRERLKPQITIDPHDTFNLEIDLDGSHASPFAWAGIPDPNSNDQFQLTAQWETPATVETAKQQLWTGKIASQPVTIKFIASQLSTPHHYIEDGFTAKAIEMMKNDPTWIHKKNGTQYTPLHCCHRDSPA